MKQSKKKTKGTRYVAKVLRKYFSKKYPNYKSALPKAREIAESLRSSGDRFTVKNVSSFIRKKRVDKGSKKQAPELFYKMTTPGYYFDLIDYMSDDYSIGAAKLGISPSYRIGDYTMLDDHVYVLKKDANYSATTQLCIWRRKFLIDVLSKIQTPWQFELVGSDYIKSTGVRVVGSTKMPLRYPEPSALSSRHPEKISVFGNRISDIEECIKRGYLKEKDLIVGQWIGHTKTYSECKIQPHYALEACPDTEVEYYKMLLDTCLR
jgi:hypothetical protein